MSKIISGVLISLFVFLFFGVFSIKTVSANVGTIEVRSITSEEYRCWAASLIMPDKSYEVTVNCANLIYPPLPPEISSYVMWATPVAGKNAIKLGDLGKGEAKFQVKQSFTSLYVTLEPNANVRTPSKNIIMSGGVEQISFLRRPTSPTPTLEVEKSTTPGKEKTATTDTSNLSTKDKLLLALRRAGIAALIALIAIVGLIFVVTRSRG